MVPEDGVIHHPTRLSEGPAWLTAAIYLNVIGSKLARERVVSKEGTKEGRGLLGNFPEAGRRETATSEVWCAVRGAEPGRGWWGGGGSLANSALPWEADGSWRSFSGKTVWQEEVTRGIYPLGYGHGIWSHNPGVHSFKYLLRSFP